jgi:hypothetical protein
VKLDFVIHLDLYLIFEGVLIRACYDFSAGILRTEEVVSEFNNKMIDLLNEEYEAYCLRCFLFDLILSK